MNKVFHNNDYHRIHVTVKMMPYNIIALGMKSDFNKPSKLNDHISSPNRNNPIGRLSNSQDASTTSFNTSMVGGNKDTQPQNKAFAYDSIFLHSFPSRSYSSPLNLFFS